MTAWKKPEPAKPQPRPKERPKEWDPETVRRIEWIEGLTLTDEPFQLNAQCRVTHPEIFLRALRVEAKKGPLGPRARYGAIQQDLHDLEQLWKRGVIKVPAKVETVNIGQQDGEECEVELVDLTAGATHDLPQSP